ncbi:hypothetical protein HDU97_010286, partial [Phlyctochytrium planicorne]
MRNKRSAQLVYLLESTSDNSSLRSVERRPSASTFPATAQEPEPEDAKSIHRDETQEQIAQQMHELEPQQHQHGIDIQQAGRTRNEDYQPMSPPPSFNTAVMASKVRSHDINEVVRATKKDGKPNETEEEKDMVDYDTDSKITKKDIDSCPLCFHIPNRAKLLTCCNNRVVCSLCIRSWLNKSDTCPFCRSYIAYPLRKNGLPDASEQQAVLDKLDVVCPYSDGGCPWVGERRDLVVHLREECVVAFDPETGEPTHGLIPIPDFCLEAVWTNNPTVTRADRQSLDLHATDSRNDEDEHRFLSASQRSRRRSAATNDDSSMRRLTAISPSRLEGGDTDSLEEEGCWAAWRGGLFGRQGLFYGVAMIVLVGFAAGITIMALQ